MVEKKICPDCYEMQSIDDFFTQTIRKGRYSLTDRCRSCQDKLYGIIRKDYSTLEAQVETIVYYENKRAQDMGLVADLTPEQWANILRQANGYCEYCHTFVSIRHLVLDHKTSLAHGGATTVSNVVAACPFCNWSKGGRSFDQWLKHLEKKGIFYQC